MLKFSNPYIFWALLGVILLLGLMVLRYAWKRRKLKKYFAEQNLSSVVPDISFGKWIFRYVILSVIFVLIVLTLTRPRFGAKVRMTQSVGVDMVLAIDVSNSMLCQDIKPNRLESTKDAVAAFLEKLGGDRVGLVAFAGQADLLVEMTNDYAAIKNILPGLHPAMFGTQGTSISEAIRVSLMAFPDELKSAGAIIILTDGEDHEGQLDEMISKARKRDIHIYTIGVGSPGGGTIPVYDAKSKVIILLTDGSNNGGEISPLAAAELAASFGIRVYVIGVGTRGKALGFAGLDFNGNVIYQYQTVEIDEKVMNQIADKTGGKYFRAVDNQTLENIFKEIDVLEKSKLKTKETINKPDKFFWLVLIGGVLFVLEILLKLTYYRSVI